MRGEERCPKSLSRLQAEQDKALSPALCSPDYGDADSHATFHIVMQLVKWKKGFNTKAFNMKAA